MESPVMNYTALWVSLRKAHGSCCTGFGWPYNLNHSLRLAALALKSRWTRLSSAAKLGICTSPRKLGKDLRSAVSPARLSLWEYWNVAARSPLALSKNVAWRPYWAMCALVSKMAQRFTQTSGRLIGV